MSPSSSSMTELIEQVKKKLAGISEPPPVVNPSSNVGKQDEAAFERQLELEKRRTEILSLRQDIKERKEYARKTFRLIKIWLGGVFVLLLLQGFSGTEPSSVNLPNGFVLHLKFNLNDNVLIAVVGGTASVIGIFVIVVKYLFSKH
jgi:hypothetical protein